MSRHSASHTMMRLTASLCILLLFPFQEAGWKSTWNISDERVQIGVICNSEERENVYSQHESTGGRGGPKLMCFLRHPRLNGICDLGKSLLDHLGCAWGEDKNNYLLIPVFLFGYFEDLNSKKNV